MKYCKDCGTVLKGRADKKFCNDHCRCNYYNMIHQHRDAGLRKINAILRKNLVILETFHKRGISSVSLDMLLAAGFSLSFFTHELPVPEEGCYRCCYHIGYLKLTPQKYLLRMF